MTTFFIILCWVAMALVEGRRDGYYFHHWNTSTAQSQDNIHWLFTMERTVIGLCLTYIHCVDQKYNLVTIFSRMDWFDIIAIGNVLLFGLGLMLAFSWFHNGMYLTTREYLQKGLYPKKWFDDSTTSLAKGEFSYKVRTAFVIAGALLIIVTS